MAYPCDNRFIFFLKALSKFDLLDFWLSFLSLSKYFSKPVGGFWHRLVHCLNTVPRLGSTWRLLNRVNWRCNYNHKLSAFVQNGYGALFFIFLKLFCQWVLQHLLQNCRVGQFEYRLPTASRPFSIWRKISATFLRTKIFYKYINDIFKLLS